MERIACTLNAGQMSERRRRWRELADRAFVSRTETERGLRLVFRDGPGVADELKGLTALERECCAFADWTVGGTVLDVTGATEEGVAAVHGMFLSL
jgi:hypothetical protein